MVKTNIFLFFFIVQAFSIDALEMAQNIVADSTQNEKLKLLFEGKNYKDENAYIKLDDLSYTLKSNALVNFNLNDSTLIQLSFKSKAQALLFLKIINESLNQAGFVHFLPLELDLKEELKTYTISLESRYILDPGNFYLLLKQNSVFIENVKKTGKTSYEYILNFDKAKLQSNVNIALNQNVKLQRPLRDYIFDLKGAKKMQLKANANDSWFAKILFLDKNLELIQSIKKQEKNNTMSIDIPNNAQYAIIGDNFNLDNIRRGLEIYLGQ